MSLPSKSSLAVWLWARLKTGVKLGTLSILAALAAGLLIFHPRGPSPPPDGFVTVDYWEKWSGFEADEMQQVVDDFNRTVGRQKRIYVRFVSLGQVVQKTLLATAAGDPPDITGLYDQQVCQWAALHALQPLDQLAADKGITRQTYKPAYWEGCQYDGHLWALVSTPSAMALHYNKRIFYENADALRATGLDPTRPPQTMSELDRYARVLERFDGGVPPRLERAGFLPALTPYLALIPHWFGGELYDSATGRLTLTSPQNIAAFNWIRSYTLRIGRDSLGDFEAGLGQFSTPQNPFLLGKLVMQQQGPWMANTIFTLAPDMSQRLVPWALERYLPHVLRTFNYDWGVAPLPSDLPGHPQITQIGFDVLTIPRGARHKAEAFEFIAYVQRQDVMEKLCTMHCKNSVLRKVSPQFIRMHPNPYIDVFERLSANPDDRPLPRTGMWPEISDEVMVAAQAVATLNRTPQQALQNAQDRLAPRLDRYNADLKNQSLH